MVMSLKDLFFKNKPKQKVEQTETIKNTQEVESIAAKKAFDLNVKYYEQGNFDIAIKEYTKAIQLSQYDEKAYFNRGVCYAKLKNYELALADFNKAIELNPSFTLVYFNRAICYRDLKEYKIFFSEIEKLVEFNPDFVKKLLYHRFLNNIILAVLNKAIRLNLNYTWFYKKRGDLYFHKLQKFELALADYNKAIEIGTNDSNIYVMRGNCYFVKNKDELALVDFNNAIQLDPGDGEAYNCRATYYLRQRNYDLALIDFSKVIQLSRNFSDDYLCRGNCYFDLKKYELAFNDFDSAIRFSNSLEDKKEHCFFASSSAVVAEKYDKARHYLEKAFENSSLKEEGLKQICLTSIDSFEELDRKNQELEESKKELEKINEQLNAEIIKKETAYQKLQQTQHSLEETNKALEESKQELENMMSMFAHKFRSPLDAILYNTTHENQVKRYTEAAQTMRGLLEIFSTISTDAATLKKKIITDNHGDGRLLTLFSKNLDMILLHLLSISGTENIQQHYMAYAKASGKIASDITFKIWCEDYFKLERELQTEWEQSFAQLLNKSPTLEQRFAWIEQHFFKLELIGFNRDTIRFKEYGITESFLTILLNEIIVNAFKYYSSENKQPVILEWTERGDYQVLSCRNPSTRDSRTTLKGSGKGHTFLSVLARKTDCQFIKPKRQDDFLLEFNIPNELCVLNPEG
jgi:tetratricopeptide (TPR) repeat protein